MEWDARILGLSICEFVNTLQQQRIILNVEQWIVVHVGTRILTKICTFTI